jgi:hypothetical protein
MRAELNLSGAVWKSYEQFWPRVGESGARGNALPLARRGERGYAHSIIVAMRIRHIRYNTIERAVKRCEISTVAFAHHCGAGMVEWPKFCAAARSGSSEPACGVGRNTVIGSFP